MLLNFSAMSMIAVASSLLCLSSAPIGSNAGSLRRAAAATKKQQSNNDNSFRRHLLQKNECLLVLKDVQYEDHHDTPGEGDRWACEFPSELFDGREFLDIVGLPKKTIEEMGVKSGEYILKANHAYVEESLDTKEMKLHIPDTTKIKLQLLDESDPRHYKTRRRVNRALASSQPGTYNVLVVRVVAANGDKISASDAQLRDDVFADEFSLKTGYEQCSKNQFVLEPGTGSGVNEGITTVTIDVNPSAGRGAMEQEAFSKASQQLGGNLRDQFDLVMFCQPPGSGNWVAYAYINSWVSFYNDFWCQRVSSQMHEIGHNLGLAHSGEGDSEYADQSGMMGFSYNIDDGPRMCFNAAKNFQLGWFDRQKESYYPMNNQNSSRSFVLNGVDDYKVDGLSNGELITLRVVEFGDELVTVQGTSQQDFGNDYYVGYNRASGPNTGTLEARNQVTVFRKSRGGANNYGKSSRVAELNAGGTFSINNFKNSTMTLQITVTSITNDGRDANINIVVGTPPDQTAPPVPSPTNAPTSNPTPFPSLPPSPSPTPLPTLSPTSPPTVPITNAPTNPPTNFPTMPPVQDPTQFPTTLPLTNPPTNAPTNKDNPNACCSYDYKTCASWGNESREACESLSGMKWLSKGALTGRNARCLSRDIGCISTPNDCCDGLVCVGTEWWKACKPNAM